MIVIPSEHRTTLHFAPPKGHQVLQVWGRPVADNYNYAVQMFLASNDDVFCTVEDDIFPPLEALSLLLLDLKTLDGAAVGAWYPRRELPRACMHMDGEYPTWRSVPDDGQLHCITYLGMGCSVYPRAMIEKIPKPLFRTFGAETQDVYFSRKAREYGFKLYVDSAIKCSHKDREVGVLYE